MTTVALELIFQPLVHVSLTVGIQTQYTRHSIHRKHQVCACTIMYACITQVFNLGPCSSSEQSSARIKQRKRQPSDKSQKSRPRKSRKKGVANLIPHNYIGNYYKVYGHRICRYFTSSICSYKHSPRHRSRKTTTFKEQYASK